MTTYVFSYRLPEAYAPGQPETVAAWTAWFESMGTNLVDQGHGVIESSALGNLGDDTRLGGYSVVAADDPDAAMALARGCPALDLGGGIEVGVFTERPPAAES
jgi:hypothetical protein